jgi:uncharacterized glyoxalase superfamily protein PhnB
MKTPPYLLFDGQCDAAFALYAQALGGTGRHAKRGTRNAERSSNAKRGVRK